VDIPVQLAFKFKRRRGLVAKASHTTRERLEMATRRGAAAIAATAAVAVVAAVYRWRRRRRKRQPHIVFVVTDQEVCWDRLPVTFDVDAALPQRARLRRSAVAFPNFVTAASPCTPSRGALYTGRHFQATGVYDNSRSLGAAAKTCGHMLRRLGYATRYCGKFHLDEALLSKAERDAAANDPRLLDDDRARGLAAVLADEAARRAAKRPHPWLKRCFLTALDRYGFGGDWSSVGDCPGWAMEGHAEDPVTAMEAAAVLRAAADDAAPLFLACNFINPHDVMFVETSEGQRATRRRPLFLETMPFAEPRDLRGFGDGAAALYGARWRALPATLHADHEELLPNSVLAHQAVVDARSATPAPRFFFLERRARVPPL